jgi:hypothetical protein
MSSAAAALAEVVEVTAQHPKRGEEAAFGG